MKFVPRDPPSSQPLPDGPAPGKRSGTTRFLRLTPAPDIPATTHLPLPRQRPARETPPPPVFPEPTPPAPSWPEEVASVPADPPLLQRTEDYPERSRPAEPVSPVAPSVPAEPATRNDPFPSEPLLAVDSPPTDSDPTPEPPAATGSQRLRLRPAQDLGPGVSAPELPQDDDRPMRRTTKRLPNVFAAAPSARWAPPSGVGSPPLRLIPLSQIAAPTKEETLLVPRETSPEDLQDPIPAAASQVPLLEAAPLPEVAPLAEMAPIPEIASPSKAAVGRIALSTELPASSAAGPRLADPFAGTYRHTAPPVPLSRLAKPERHSLGRGFWILLLILAIALALLLYFFGLTPRLVAGRELDHEQKLSTERIVGYGVARLATPHVELPLPGTIEASQQASLYARTNGYVKKWLVDIGDQVVAGQLLAELDTPEVDQQLTEAMATSEQARAGLAIAQSNAQRWDIMAKARAVAQEDADEKDAAKHEAQSAFNAAQANVARLTDLENFKEIRAPFPGKITYRNIDVGTLVTSGPGAPNSELFRVAQTDPLRVYVDVPESNAPAIKAGVKANIQVPSYPGRVFHGEVVRDAGALSDASRTLRTELRVANPDGALLPGAFAEVRLQLLDSAPAVLIPASALIVNAAGTSVAILQDRYGHDVVHYTPVRVGRDFGTEVEILENVREGDRLVTNPPTDMNDGTAVTAKPDEKPPSEAPIHPPSPRA